MTVQVLHGDCLEVLRGLDDCSVDAIVTDPPYGLSNTKPAQVADVLKAWVAGDDNVVPEGKGFMGKSWDGFVPPPAVWKECMRVLKPGGHMAVFAGARTQDLMGLSIRLAGFEIRDTLGWVYSQGFPKSMDISKAIDKQKHKKDDTLRFTLWLREQCEVLGISRNDLDKAAGTSDMGGWWTSSLPHRCAIPTAEQWESIARFFPALPDWAVPLIAPANQPGEAWEKREVVGVKKAGIATPGDRNRYTVGGSRAVEVNITTPATPESAKWDGWGTNLKPAIEPIILARKPLVGTVAGNVLAYGVGGLNIDASRVGTEGGSSIPGGIASLDARNAEHGYRPTAYKTAPPPPPAPAGRFPANVLLDEHAAAEMDEQSGITKDGVAVRHRGVKGGEIGPPGNKPEGTADMGYGGGGGASRFFPVFKSEEATPETKGRFPANVLLDEHAAAEMDKQSGWQKDGTAVNRNRNHGGDKNNAVYNGGWKIEPEDVTYGNGGGASRFFPVFKYQAKAPKRERPVVEREDGTKIQHPTVKPEKLMEWLVELITPPGGVVLDPFAGSGTTLQAALNKGFQPIGIEQDADYIKLIEKRLEVEPSTHNS